MAIAAWQSHRPIMSANVLKGYRSAAELLTRLNQDDCRPTLFSSEYLRVRLIMKPVVLVYLRRLHTTRRKLQIKDT
jgi:hypothetical protein